MISKASLLNKESTTLGNSVIHYTTSRPHSRYPVDVVEDRLLEPGCQGGQLGDGLLHPLSHLLVFQGLVVGNIVRQLPVRIKKDTIYYCRGLRLRGQKGGGGHLPSLGENLSSTAP